MATRKALGRGLSALIPPPQTRPGSAPSSVGEQEEGTPGPLYIAVANVAPNPNQPRKQFRERELSALAASIREQGVLQPVVARRRGDGYELIIGERRWRAAQLAGLAEIPAVILDASDREVVEMALVENVQRADLNPIELAEAFRVLVEDEGMTQDEAGRRVGLDRSTVANHLRVLELSIELQQDLIDQRLSLGHAKAILQAPSDQRRMVRDQIVRGGLSVRAAEDLCRKLASGSSGPAVRSGPTRDLHVVHLEDQLRTSVQTKVRIVGRPGRGRIELHYFGEAELDRLAALLLSASAQDADGRPSR